jgi:hypothetical protein
MDNENMICQYSDLPSPLAYLLNQQKVETINVPAPVVSPKDIDRVIEMA